MPTISLENITVRYDKDGYELRPLDGLDRQIHDGTLTLLLGPSGCGKTTLLSCIGGLKRPDGGRVVVGGSDLSKLDDDGLREYRRTRIGFVFQSFNLIASLSARDNVAAPLISQGVDRSEALARADEVLAQVGMAEHARSRPGHLSGGQQQRVAVARGIVHDPEVLLADEPTANLDYVQAEAVIQLLRGLARPGRIVVISTHDDRLLPIADEVVNLSPVIDESASAGRIELVDGQVLFHEGDRGNLVYVLDAGSLDLVRGTGGREELLARLQPGRYFGELGAMLGQPRTATARANGPAVVEAMTLQEFRVRSRHAAQASRETAAVRETTAANGNGRASANGKPRRRAPLRAK